MKKIITNLTFLIMCMFASVSFADEAFYDSETGVAVIPDITIDGQTQSIILQQNDDSSFDVVGDTTLNSENLAVQKKKSSGGTSTNSRGECHPNRTTPGKTPSGAKELFSKLCGISYNDQKGHHCEWVEDGWICYGNPHAGVVVDNDGGIGPIKAAHNQHGECHTNYAFSKKSTAKYFFEKVCKVKYDDKKYGDHCEWPESAIQYPSGKKGGWICYGWHSS